MLAYAPFGKIIPKDLINEVIAELDFGTEELYPAGQTRSYRKR
jgi:hypothetical protein